MCRHSNATGHLASGRLLRADLNKHRTRTRTHTSARCWSRVAQRSSAASSIWAASSASRSRSARHRAASSVVKCRCRFSLARSASSSTLCARDSSLFATPFNFDASCAPHTENTQHTLITHSMRAVRVSGLSYRRLSLGLQFGLLLLIVLDL